MRTRTLLQSAAAVLVASTGLALAQSPANTDHTYPAKFEQVEIRTLAEAVAAASNKTIMVHPKVEGLVTLVSEHPLSGSQMYAAFGQVLAVKGYVVEDAGGVVKVYPGKPGRPDK